MLNTKTRPPRQASVNLSRCLNSEKRMLQRRMFSNMPKFFWSSKDKEDGNQMSNGTDESGKTDIKATDEQASKTAKVKPVPFDLHESVSVKVANADEYHTSDIDKPVRIRIDENHKVSAQNLTVPNLLKRIEEQGKDAPQYFSVPFLLKSVAEEVPSKLALAVKREDKWYQWTYSDYYINVVNTARSFIKLGIETSQGICIIGSNAPEWHFANLAANYAGAIAVGIHESNSANTILDIANQVNCGVMVVENREQLKKVLLIKDKIPYLKAIVQYTGKAKKHDNTYSWSKFIELGVDVPDSEIQNRLDAIYVNKCSTILFSSGTTGEAKGIMLSHDNITSMAHLLVKEYAMDFGKEVVVGFLPPSHIAGQITELYGPLAAAATCYFAQPDAYKGSFIDTLKEVRPTLLVMVPHLWEKLQDKIEENLQDSNFIKRKMFTFAQEKGREVNETGVKSSDVPFMYDVYDSLVFKRLKEEMGLDRTKLFITTAAPITRRTLDFFLSIDIQLCDVYGLTETSGPHTLNLPSEYQLGSVGQCPDELELKIEDYKDEGEILLRGRNVMMGYVNRAEETREFFDLDGFAKSGDIGRLDDKDFLFITGRNKDIVITSGGENISVSRIENMVKEALPIVSNCMVIGEMKNYLTMLISLKVEVDEKTRKPSDFLTQAAKSWCVERGSKAIKVSEILSTKDENILKAIQVVVDDVNGLATSRAHTIRKWTIVPRDFSVPDDTLTPTMKVKRQSVAEKYKKTIDAFYE